MSEYRYFLKAFYDDKWKEVTQDEFVKAERHAGFRPKGAGPVATGGFSGGGLEGRIELKNPPASP